MLRTLRMGSRVLVVPWSWSCHSVRFPVSCIRGWYRGDFHALRVVRAAVWCAGEARKRQWSGLDFQLRHFALFLFSVSSIPPTSSAQGLALVSDTFHVEPGTHHTTTLIFCAQGTFFLSFFFDLSMLLISAAASRHHAPSPGSPGAEALWVILFLFCFNENKIKSPKNCVC